ncbi:MAG TPA: glycerol-3-phosphate dehydrogenase C-terminal domain-containing protein, partial [bacterium]|nr:glycerol-3-phosphate dehydrogenase C-terminal domain-containing protein [bacterium]
LAEALPALLARARRLRVPRMTLRHLIRARGTAAAAVLDCVEERPAWGEPLCRGWPHIGAEVVVAVRDEMAVTLADVLLRRTRLALLLPGQGTEIAAQVAALMGDELAWSQDARSAQVADYTRAASHFAVSGITTPV